MILTCPACSARYMISTDSIGKAGRTVRCASCKHEWFQKSQKDSLDDLISRIQAEEFDEIDFATSDKNSSKAKAKFGFIAKILDPITTYRARLNFWAFRKIGTIKAKLLKIRKLFPESKKDLIRLGIGCVTATLCFSALSGLMIISHNKISEHFPDTIPVFEKMGLKYVSPKINYNEAVAVDRLEINTEEQEDGDHRSLTGMLINLTSKSIPTPDLEINILNKDGEIIQTKSYIPEQAELEKEGLIDFKIALLDKIPSDAQKIQIYLNSPSEHKEKQNVEDGLIEEHLDSEQSNHEEKDTSIGPARPFSRQEEQIHEEPSEKTHH
ncbi:MAG TPA: zinc-ribbon domain-containing protein [Alphaproteobacteria bacterium]|nr:zinc-ribbon domain-containing protein [Alphaproteobacteria bacterium]HOO49788.1 zinc-ribbon domain-containing protein [Alphaproteobacteria bacterium]